MNSEVELPVTIMQWDRNAREKVRVALDRYRNHDTIDLRLWWPGPEGELRPGKGLTIGIRHLPRLAQAIGEALDLARKHRLLPPADDGGEHEAP